MLKTNFEDGAPNALLIKMGFDLTDSTVVTWPDKLNIYSNSHSDFIISKVGPHLHAVSCCINIVA